MRVRRSYSALRWISIVFLLIAVILLTIQLVLYSRARTRFPEGMAIAGVSVSGLSRQQAAERLLEVYSLPVELHYNEAAIHLNPAVVDFDLDLESMLAAADLQRASGSFWLGFWDYLWGRKSSPQSVPLDATYSESLLRTYLEEEIATRYDKPPTPPKPVVGTVSFRAGDAGSTVDIDRAVLQIENALRSPSQRTVELPLQRTSAARPSLQNLEILLKQTIDLARYDGLAGVYLIDLQSAQEIHFLYQLGQTLATEPDPAFTAASIVKIPIMVSIYQRIGEEPNGEVQKLLEDMITQSGNDPADWLMEQVLDPGTGPLIVTEDMRSLGLESTFLAGQFRLGSPLLVRYNTPGNTRPDINTDPDPYNQTTLTEMGMLLADIYQCARTGGGNLVAVFPGEITQAECQEMIELLTRNEAPFLIEAGLPTDTRIAHKHGWVSDTTGAIRTIGDAAIVFTPSGDYVLVVFFYHPVQLIWEPVSGLIADLSRAVYNYFNIPAQ